MPTYAADFAIAQSTSMDMRVLSKQILETIEEMNTHLRTDLAEWQDEASDAHTVTQDVWNEGATYMPSRLALAEQALNSIMEHYGEAVRQGTRMWQS